MDKVNMLSTGEKAVVGGGILMLIASFFNWWNYSELGFDFGSDGWSAPGSIWSTLLILIAIVLAAVTAAIRLGNVQMPSLPSNWTWGMIYGGGAAISVLLLILKAWRIMAAPVGGFGIGFFLGLIATVAIAYGGYMLYAADKGAGFSGLRR